MTFNSDNALGFLLAVVAHIIGLFLVGGGMFERDETPPRLNVSTLELALVEDEVPPLEGDRP
ncbi:MAG: hypothetical protein FWH21_06855, partial [Kiritimatiellaeota bacterium]|nr:hypothetical protein [Kiritimatiellota bacterium]